MILQSVLQHGWFAKGPCCIRFTNSLIPLYGINVIIRDSLAPEVCGTNFKNVILKLIICNSNLATQSLIALMWMPQNLTDEKSTLVEVMAWCCQATSHYLSHCWPRSMSPYGITRPQWVNNAPGNNLSPKYWCQAITCVNGNLLLNKLIFQSKHNNFHTREYIFTIQSAKL